MCEGVVESCNGLYENHTQKTKGKIQTKITLKISVQTLHIQLLNKCKIIIKQQITSINFCMAHKEKCAIFGTCGIEV